MGKGPVRGERDLGPRQAIDCAGNAARTPCGEGSANGRLWPGRKGMGIRRCVRVYVRRSAHLVVSGTACFAGRLGSALSGDLGSVVAALLGGTLNRFELRVHPSSQRRGTQIQSQGLRE